MMNSCRYSFRYDLTPLVSHSLLVAGIAALGVLSGLVPSWNGRSSALEFSQTAQAQSFSADKIQSFARSTLEIELAREAALQSLGAEGRGIRFECDLGAGTVANLSSFSGETRQQIQSFCNQSQAILQQNGLSAADFRQIKTTYERNPAQYTQITGAFQRLCQEGRFRNLQICR
ncbi:DUF4168 domain-containing protein [Desertifilum sp. FACHB-1129]|uniref:DUF4168 domain-containing protein n=1 Tax=Desertifilum TaxID=1185872 RepID=UPI001300D977|nr:MULTISPECIES: DUF4168 domain-containing protein [Desertifilum]MCD8488984.1 DUF4168 domain-containing protein [Desertifilum sp.]MDA0212740.1 DUF4168 domain-containing protein [Cyanobacteria bacterium FC1]MDI9636464.1 DUF4168 domain-containing protein [Geitlerinema splendidum]MDK3156478.1 DUF4168 domain-containing protein [Kamptonema cortianum]MBD2313352.1 DUF4168 domain-containing protein [Desertifilum sp. FACHB-1129]